MTQVGRTSTRGYGFVNPAVVRGSTVLHPDLAHMRGVETARYEQAVVYGTHGTPTHFALEDAVAEIEGGTRCQVVSSGLAAVTTALLVCGGILAGFGVETT
jgi:cystathionine beta-lyase